MIAKFKEKDRKNLHVLIFIFEPAVESNILEIIIYYELMTKWLHKIIMKQIIMKPK